MSTETEYSLAELLIVAAAEAWRHDGEILATGITVIPRLAASLAKASFNPALLMTDSEINLVADPVPPGKRLAPIAVEGWAPYARTFDMLWSGKRHAMVGPVQIDRFGQTNISVIGDHKKPKSAMLGARGFPGNSIYHPNSYFFPNHNSRAFVAGEVDFVCGAGYNPQRFPQGFPRGLDLRLIVTNLAVLDFSGPGHAIAVKSLHPGVSFEMVQDNTGFPLHRPGGEIAITPAPDATQLRLIRDALDPNRVRDTVLK